MLFTSCRRSNSNWGSGATVRECGWKLIGSWGRLSRNALDRTSIARYTLWPPLTRGRSHAVSSTWVTSAGRADSVPPPRPRRTLGPYGALRSCRYRAVARGLEAAPSTPGPASRRQDQGRVRKTARAGGHGGAPRRREVPGGAGAAIEQPPRGSPGLRRRQPSGRSRGRRRRAWQRRPTPRLDASPPAGGRLPRRSRRGRWRSPTPGASRASGGRGARRVPASPGAASPYRPAEPPGRVRWTARASRPFYGTGRLRVSPAESLAAGTRPVPSASTSMSASRRDAA